MTQKPDSISRLQDKIARGGALSCPVFSDKKGVWVAGEDDISCRVETKTVIREARLSVEMTVRIEGPAGAVSVTRIIGPPLPAVNYEPEHRKYIFDAIAAYKTAVGNV